MFAMKSDLERLKNGKTWILRKTKDAIFEISVLSWRTSSYYSVIVFYVQDSLTVTRMVYPPCTKTRSINLNNITVALDKMRFAREEQNNKYNDRFAKDGAAIKIENFMCKSQTRLCLVWYLPLSLSLVIVIDNISIKREVNSLLYSI